MGKNEQKEYIIGNYKLLGKLGQGGFAIVYLGKHIYLERLSAIKLIYGRTDLASSDLEAFLTEARTIARLEHPNIVHIQDFGIADLGIQDFQPYLVMDYAPNGSLHARHPEGRGIPPQLISQYVIQIGEALQFAHDNNVVHCDVKPENMLLGKNNQVLLSDFGIAVVIQNSLKTKDIVGSLHYMAPEQFRGKPQPASDQYGLAIVVYRWLSGAVPFRGNSSQLPHFHQNVPPRPLHELVPGIPRRVEQVVFKALAKDPGKRFSSIREFAQAFVEALQGPTPAQEPDQRAKPAVQPTPEVKPAQGPIRLSANDPLVDHSPAETTYKSKQERERGRQEAVAPAKEEGERRDRAGEERKGGGREVADQKREERVVPIVARALSRIVADEGAGAISYSKHAGWVSAVSWSGDGRIASGSWDSTVQIWKGNSGETEQIYRGHTQTVKAVCWSPDGRYIASGSWDSTVQIWDAATGENCLGQHHHTVQVETVSWSPNGRYLASAGHDGIVQVWRADNGHILFTYRGHKGPIWSVAWSPDGQRIASASHDKSVQIWDALSGNEVLVYQGHSQPIAVIAWSPNGKWIASGSHDGEVQVWQTSTGEMERRYQDTAGAVKALGWSANGRQLAFAVKKVQVWEIDLAKRMQGSEKAYSYEGHTGWVNALAWAPDGGRIASGSDDKTIQVWEPEIGF